MSSPPHPPSLLNLTSILTHLLPPSFPLPVDLLSTPLKTRQIYLPPPQGRMLHDGYISLNPGTGKSSQSSSGESERSDKTLVDPARRESGFGLISTLTNGSHPPSHGPTTSNDTPDDAISLRLTAISHKLLELQTTSRDTVQGENPDSGRWVVDLLGGPQHDHHHDQSYKKESWVHYRRPDEETLLARVDLRGLPVSSAEQDKDKEDKEDGKGETEHVEVFLLHEPSTLGVVGPNVQVGNAPRAETGERGETEWKLFDVRLVPSHPSADGVSGRSGWVSDLADIPISARGGLVGDEVEDGYGEEDGWGSDVREDDGEGEAGVGGDDFWGGYDDDDEDGDEPDSPSKTEQTSGNPNVKPNPPHLTFSSSVSFSHPVPEPEDDPYWQSYNSVEDGLRPSNPPTPGVRSPGGFGYGTAYGDGHDGEVEMGTEGYYGMTTSSGSDARLGGGARTPGREKDYWGTGGETPVGWSPQARETPLPSMMDDQADRPDVPASLEADRPDFSPAGDHATRDRSATITLAPTTTGAQTTTSAAPADPAREARQEHLRSALRAMKGMYGGDEGEWDEVVREFATR